ncbi:MAG: BTAD domain-containing putative transcriptional regulator [Acidimicrobiales bacterium]
MNRAATITKGLLALFVLAVLAGGIPWALWHFIGWPLPHHLPGWHQLSADLSQHGIADTTLVKALACVVWLAWAVLIASVTVELPATIRGRAAAHLPIAGPLQPMVGQLLAAVAIAALSITPRPTSGGPQPLVTVLGAGRAAPPVPAFALAADATPAAITTALVDEAAPPGPQPAGAAGQPLRTYQVARNDTLWGIAERELGDPLRWRDIYALSQDRPQPGGARLVDPHWIDPGWTLLLPADPPATTGSPVAVAAPADPPSNLKSPPAPTPPATTPPVAGRAAEDPPVNETAPPSAQAPAVPGSANAAPATVTLPSGSVVAGTFAAGVLSTIAIGRLRRRHGYQPTAPEPGRSLAQRPLGATIRRLGTALAEATAEPDEASEEAPPVPAPVTAVAEDDDDGSQATHVIDIGERHDIAVTVGLAELSGVALLGDGADGAARAWATALLTRAGPLAAEIAATTATSHRLFGDVGEMPGIRTVDNDTALIRLLESEVVARTRKLLAAGVDDASAYRQANPAEPLPAILAIIDRLTAAAAARLAPTVRAAGRLGMAVVFLSDSDAASLRLRLDQARVASVDPAEQAQSWTGACLFGMNVAETRDVLAVLRGAEFRPTSEDNPEWTEVIERMEHPPPEPEPWPLQPPAERPGGLEAPIRVDVLGPLTITAAGTTVSRGLRSVAKELLVYYLLRPEGATVDEAVDKLWPDTDPKMVHRQFWTAASNLRSRLRQGSEAESKILDLAGDVYRLDSQLVSADLWDFEAALTEAVHAKDDAATVAALRRAVECYRGELAQDAGWLWAEAPREDLHRRALDAHLRLAELEATQSGGRAAEAVLERAIRLDRYAEEPYRRLMSLQAARGDTDAVKATWRALGRRLVEIDLDPDPATARLYRRLAGDDVEARRPAQ